MFLITPNTCSTLVRIPRDGEQGFRVKMNGIPEGREHDSTGT
jgi:hypothetical protein